MYVKQFPLKKRTKILKMTSPLKWDKNSNNREKGNQLLMTLPKKG